MDGLISKSMLVIFTLALAACSGEGSPAAAEGLAQDWIGSERPVLRQRRDPMRNRVWVLTLAGVEVYDSIRRQRIAQVPLPGWLWVEEQYTCSPDLAIGPGGEALVSSNIVPSLWRIDPVTLAVSQHDLALVDDKGRDIGFTALSYSAQHGSYFGFSALHGSLWRIDPLLKTAQSVAPAEAGRAEPCRNG